MALGDKLIFDTETSEYIDPEGTYWESVFDYVWCRLLGFCGCGCPDQVAAYVVRMLKGYSESLNSTETLFFLYWADDKELMEHGGSVFGSWLTDLGGEVLEFLEQHLKTLDN